MEKNKIFISHSSEDKQIADAICHRLEENGLRCWIAPRDVDCIDWATAIMNGIHKSDVFVVIVSHNSIVSAEVTKEIAEATRSCRYILPFKVDNEMLNDRMRYHLGPCHWLDAVTPPLEQHISELVSRIMNLSNNDAVYLNINCVSLAEKMVYPRELFVGREKEVELIASCLSENHVLFLEGMGGIGKSEIAKSYAKQHYDCYDKIIFANYSSDIISMVCSDEIPIRNMIRAEEESQEQWYHRKLEMFHSLVSDKTLLIIDNFDVEDDVHLQELLSSPCGFLITSRNQHTDYPSLQITALERFDDVRTLFRKNYNKPLSANDMKIVDEILQLVNCHTITVELIARQMRASFLSPEKMLKKLRTTGINLNLKEKIKRDGMLEKLTAFDYITRLFSLSDTSNEEKDILCNMTLIPPCGIRADILSELFELEDYDAVNALISKNWIYLDEENDIIRMHPVISEVVKAQLHPSLTVCRRYIHALMVKMWGCWFFTAEERNELYPYVLQLFHTFPLPDRDTFMSYCSLENVMWICGDFDLAQKTGHRIYEYAEREFGENAVETGEAAMSLAGAYHNAGDDKTAEGWYKRSLAVMRQNAAEPTAVLAKGYMKVGRCACLNGKYQEAKEYYDRAMKVYQKLIEKNIVDPISGKPEQYEDLHVEIERLLIAEGKFEEALKVCQISLDMYNEEYGEDNTNAAYCLVDMGICCSMLGRYEEAEKHLLHALRLNKQKNDKASIQTARTTETMADNELRRGNVKKAGEILSDLYIDLETNFGSDNPLTVRIGEKCRETGADI